ncbi:hypothetical protein GCM10011344_25140 [Dokdonia pacifica]|uniref:eCIS core domain-containing protein n=1 Tax=Dokdonia pacifica TaxID=1627892 RepID=A0A238WRJ1_9FLAO|nr:DUF4157 domain-containing protein [Dokdonia pacifica]GGG23368.1 hypothetical protein GCM10011344_25140 [Dokdonia pacifica]SNR48884.1 protein of unknown function [Dokdonia pacifica]
MFAAKNTTQSASSAIASKGENAFIQPKLNVGKPDDRYEVEADNAADQIVSKSNEPSTQFFPATPAIQRQPDEEIQTQEGNVEQAVVAPITPGVQLKEASTEQKTDEEENTGEEDLQMMTDKESVKETSPEDTLQTKEAIDITPTLLATQKTSQEDLQSKEEEDIQEKEDEETQTVQKQASGDEGSVNPSVESTLQNSKGGGSPLDTNTKNEMESGFGADFSEVRVHNDSDAIQMNQQLGAQAFTNENDIYFNEGKYDPKSDSGKHLLAHELTHTVQQGASNSVQAKVIQKQDADPPTGDKKDTNVKVKEKKKVTGSQEKYNSEKGKDKGKKEKLPEIEKKEGKDKDIPEKGKDKEESYPEKLNQIYGLDPDKGKNKKSKKEKGENKEKEEKELQAEDLYNEPQLPEITKVSKEYTTFKNNVLTHRKGIIENSKAVKEKITNRNKAEKQAIIAGFSSQKGNLKQGHAGRVKKIKTALTREKLLIRKAEKKKIEEVHAASLLEVITLSNERDLQKSDLKAKAKKQSKIARSAGDAAMKEIKDAAETESFEMLFIAIKKGDQYKNYDRANRIKAMAKEKASARIEEVNDIVKQLKDVRKPLDDLADQIIKDGDENAGKFDEGYTEGVKEIWRQNDAIAKAIKEHADKSVKQLDENGTLFIEALKAKTDGEEDKMEKLLVLLSTELDNQAQDAIKHVDKQTVEALQIVDDLLTTVTTENSNSKGEEAKKAFTQAEAELLTMIESFNNEINIIGNDTIKSMGGTKNNTLGSTKNNNSKASSGIDGSVDAIIGNIIQTRTNTVDQINKIAQDGKLSIAKITTSFKEKSAESIKKQNDGWDKAIADTKAKVDQNVKPAVKKIQDKSIGLEGEIAKEAERIENESWWERALNFIGGIFVGFFMAIYDFLAFIFSSFWMAVLAIVVIIVVVVLAVKFAIVAAVLLVIGIIVAIVLVIYYVYQAITRDDLSDYERGQFVGRAVFEVVLTLIPARYLKIGKVLKITRSIKGLKNADPIRISKLIKAMGSADEAEKLLKLTKDVALAEKLFKQIGDVSKIERFVLSFKSVDDAMAALKKLKEVSRIEKIIAKVGAENFAILIKNSKFKNASLKQIDDFFNVFGADDIEKIMKLVASDKLKSLQQINTAISRFGKKNFMSFFTNYKFNKATLAQVDELLKSSKIANGEDFVKLILSSKVKSIEQLNTILANAKVPGSKNILKAFDQTKFTGETLLRALDSKLINSIDELTSLGRLVKNKGNFSGKAIAELLHHSSVKKLEDLKNLFKFSKIKGGTKQITDALATGKIDDIKDLNIVLASDKVDSMADLLKVLKSETISDIGLLKKLVATNDLTNLKQFQKILDKGVLKTADELKDILKEPGKLKEILKAIDAAVHIPGVGGGKFAAWFDALSSKELALLLTNKANKVTIGNRIRHPGGQHEWLMVSKTPHVKGWGTTIAEIWLHRTPTKDIRLTNKFPPPRDHGSGLMHIELADIISKSSSLDDFATRLSAWAKTALVGGVSDLPPGLRR